MQLLPASPTKKKKIGLTDALMNNTGGRIIESVPEPKEKEKEKCVICVVDMCSQRDRSSPVNLYIYDKEKFKYEAQTWPDLSYENKKWSGRDCPDMEPIGSIHCCPTQASYITFGSYLFRIGGVPPTHHLNFELFQDSCPELPTPWDWDNPDVPSLRGTPTVDIIDLNSEYELMVPTDGPSMNCSRIEPHLLILLGNLYVASGLIYRSNAPMEDIVFMEVLKKPTASIADWYWEKLPNPPPYCVTSVAKLPYDRVIAGAVESIGAIVVGVLDYCGTYSFYGYQPTSSTWYLCTTYANISLSPNLSCLRWRTAVVSGEFMLWILCPGGDYLSTLLYVMDLANDKLNTIDLFDKKLLPHTSRLAINYGCPPTLLKREEREFCVFWTQLDDDPKYSSGPDTYVALHASTFTLEKTGEGTLDVKQKEHYISLVPDVVQSLNLDEVLIADVPDNKQQRWTTFC